jgi:exonuclease III
MKFIYWNIRGLGNPARRRQLKDLISGEGLGGIGIQETIKKEFSA